MLFAINKFRYCTRLLLPELHTVLLAYREFWSLSTYAYYHRCLRFILNSLCSSNHWRINIFVTFLLLKIHEQRWVQAYITLGVAVTEPPGFSVSRRIFEAFFIQIRTISMQYSVRLKIGRRHADTHRLGLIGGGSSELTMTGDCMILAL